MHFIEIIVKAAVSGEALGALSEFNIYKKEMEFYCKIVPQIKNALKRLCDYSQLTVETFGVCETNTAILLEDLSAKSYGLASIYQGLGVNDAKFVLKNAAKFHAINAVLQQDNENIFENFKYGKLESSPQIDANGTKTNDTFFSKGMISRHTDAFNAFYTSQLDVLIEVVESWPEFDAYSEKLRRLRPHIIEKLRTAFDVNPNDFNTLIHGDMCVYFNFRIKIGLK